MNIKIDPTAPMPSDADLYAAAARADAGESIAHRMPSLAAYRAMAARLPQIASRVQRILL